MQTRASDRILCCLRPDCCRPILLEHSAISFARQSFVADTLHQMESSHPDAVGEMLAHAAFMFVVGPDGTARSAGSGSVYWKPRVASEQITETFAERTWGWPSAAAFAIVGADIFTSFTQPYCAELPAAVLEIVAAEPSSAIGLGYQRYVRSTYLPAVRRIAAGLREHAAAIEWPSVAWLKEKYPGRSRVDSADTYASIWLGYTRSWETLLAAWDEGGCAAGNDPLCRCLLSSVPDHRHPPSRRRGRHRRRLTGADG